MAFHVGRLAAMLLASTALVTSASAQDRVPPLTATPRTMVAVPPPAPPPPPPPPPTPANIQPEIERGAFLSREYWGICDGYGTPEGASGGLTGPHGFAEEKTSGRSPFGMGLAVCDAALEDPRLQLAERRANILQARALHKAARGDREAAFADLDESDRLLTGQLGRRSIGANSQLVRAWLHHQAGNREDAARLSRAAIEARPWEPIFRDAAARLHLAATNDWERFIADNRELARIDPNRLLNLFVMASIRGDWDQVVEIFPQVVLVTPQNRGGFMIEGLLQRRVDQMRVRAELHSTYAYGLAALGRRDDAARAIAAARAELQDRLDPPLPTGNRTELTRAQRAEHAAFVAGGAGARRTIDRHALLIELRGKVAAGDYQAAYTATMEARLGLSGASFDLIKALAEAAPGDATGLNRLREAMQSVLAVQLDTITRFDVDTMLGAFTGPEIAAAMPSYDSGSDSLLGLNSNGYRTHAGIAEGTQTVRFASNSGTLATSNEMVLLRAAELARRGQHRGFVLIARRVVQRHVVTVGMWGSGGAGRPAGQESEVDIVFVDPANLPATLAGAGWRVLDPEQVWAALSPIYARSERAAR